MTAIAIQECIDRVRELTKARGMQSTLARDLNVSRQLVSAWLKGTHLPSGNHALALRNWLFGAERSNKKKDGVGALTPTPRKARTQKDKSNEKPSPARRRR
jgi:transcriptional regulator with XRE-family HTH domain